MKVSSFSNQNGGKEPVAMCSTECYQERIPSTGTRRYGKSPRSSNFSPHRKINSSRSFKTKPSPLPKMHDESDVDENFEDYSNLGERLAKSMYYAGRLPQTSRPSFPLTVLAVNAFTSATLGMELESLDFLDLDMASEIGRSACVSPTAIVMALVYVDRLAKNNQKYLASMKPSELFVVALLVASKFMQEDGEEYGINTENWTTPSLNKTRLNELEINFLSAIDWNLIIGMDEFERTLCSIQKSMAVTEGTKRGWWTYTELTVLSSNWENLWPFLYTYTLQVVTVACITYVGMVMTLMTSTMLTPELMTLSRNFLMSLSTPLLDSHCQDQPFIFTHFGNESENNSHALIPYSTFSPSSANWTTESACKSSFLSLLKRDNQFRKEDRRLGLIQPKKEENSEDFEQDMMFAQSLVITPVKETDFFHAGSNLIPVK